MSRPAGIPITWTGLVLILCGLGSSAWAVGQLADGVREITRHWWGALALLPLLAGIAMTAVGLFRAGRSLGSSAP